MAPTFSMETVVIADRWKENEVKHNFGVRDFNGLPAPGCDLKIDGKTYRVQKIETIRLVPSRILLYEV